MPQFPFRFSPLYRVLAAPFGITPGTAAVGLDDQELTVRFGPWILSTPVTNITGAERTGPFSVAKTAGPAHLSLADRGLTCATNPDEGLCLTFEEPVAGIDPWGRIRHPGLTVTVEDVDGLAEALAQARAGEPLGSDTGDLTIESPGARAGRWLRWPAGMALAGIRYLANLRRLDRSFETRAAEPDLLASIQAADGDRAQPAETGVGDIIERVYRMHLAAPHTTSSALLDMVCGDFNAVSPREVAEFVPSGPDADATEQSEYLIRMPGPWNGPVQVVERLPDSLTLATLEGHMEAGKITFGVHEPDEGQARAGEDLVVEIRSLARSATRPFDLLYRRLRVGAEMQMQMWVHVLHRIAEVADADIVGNIEVHTIRHQPA